MTNRFFDFRSHLQLALAIQLEVSVHIKGEDVTSVAQERVRDLDKDKGKRGQQLVNPTQRLYLLQVCNGLPYQKVKSA